MDEAFDGLNTFDDPLCWDVSSVTTMERMFRNAKVFNQDLSAWDVSSVTRMTEMFYLDARFNQDLSAWDVSNVTTMRSLFQGAIDFNRDLSAWDVSSVTTMEKMLRNVKVFNHDLSAWDVSSVTTMRHMFYLDEMFNQDLSAWDVSSVTDLSTMFEFAKVFNQDLSAWDVSSVTTMHNMFKVAKAFNQDLCAWVSKSPQLGNVSDMFLRASSCNNSSTPVLNSGTPADPHPGPFSSIKIFHIVMVMVGSPLPSSRTHVISRSGTTNMSKGRVQSRNEMSNTICCLASRSFCLGIQYLCKHPVSMHSVTIAMFQSSDWINHMTGLQISTLDVYVTGAIAIHPHSDPRNHSTRLCLVYLLVHALKVFDGLVAGLLVENTMRVAWLFLGAGYGLSW
eukprot:scaffold174623_cov71-Attheya_sp.AAC.1